MATITYIDTGANDPNLPMIDWLSWIYEASRHPVADPDFRDYVMETHEHSPLVNWWVHFAGASGGSYIPIWLPDFPETVDASVKIPNTILTGYTLRTPTTMHFDTYAVVDGLSVDARGYQIYNANSSSSPWYTNRAGAYSAFLAAAQQAFGGGDDTIYGSSRGDL